MSARAAKVTTEPVTKPTVEAAPKTVPADETPKPKKVKADEADDRGYGYGYW